MSGLLQNVSGYLLSVNLSIIKNNRENQRILAEQRKAVPLHAMVALGGRGAIACTHS
jgi:hypothetical protein